MIVNGRVAVGGVHCVIGKSAMVMAMIVVDMAMVAVVW